MLDYLMARPPPHGIKHQEWRRVVVPNHKLSTVSYLITEQNNQYSLSFYYVPVTVLCARDTELSKTELNLSRQGSLHESLYLGSPSSSPHPIPALSNSVFI